MPFDAYQWIQVAWSILGVIWISAAFSNKRTARRQPLGPLFIHIVLLAVVFNLVFNDVFRRGLLGVRFLPDSDVLRWLGFLVTVAGLGSSIWARFSLGRNWSGTVTVKHDHELVRKGPYSLVRHPIYSGLSLALLGTVLAIGEVRGLIALPLLVLEFKRKSLLEERFMIEEFGAQYVEYRDEVKALIPFVW